MSNGQIPPRIDPRKWMDSDASLSGAYAFKEMPRLCQQLADCDGEVSVTLSFSRDPQGLALMHCRFETSVSMVCQRCLEPASFLIQGDYDYVLLREGQTAEGLPEEYDALELGDDPLDVRALVEDELMLALPIVPTHDPGICQHPAGFVEPEPGPSENEDSRPNPFSVLAQLKRDPKV